MYPANIPVNMRGIDDKLLKCTTLYYLISIGNKEMLNAVRENACKI